MYYIYNIWIYNIHEYIYINIFTFTSCIYIYDSPNGSVGKESTCNAGDAGLIPKSGRFPGGWPGNPLQFSCLENPMDRGGWWATVHGVTKS